VAVFIVLVPERCHAAVWRLAANLAWVKSWSAAERGSLWVGLGIEEEIVTM
jgi:hypothetical protein